MTIIGFVRHGITDWNQQLRAQGQQDVPLNLKGRLQADQIARRLSGEQWDYIFASDLMRASETADRIAQAMGRQVDGYDRRLREKTHGRLDGTTIEERIAAWGIDWKDLDHNEESPEKVIERAFSFVEEIVEKYPDKKILIVSHGAWIRIVMNAILTDFVSEMPPNTSLSLVQKQDTGWSCILSNCVQHLAMNER